MYLVSAGLIPDGSLAFTLTVVIAGLGIVLSTLALLILVFSVFGKITAKAEERAKKKNAVKIADNPPSPPEIKKASGVPLPPPIVESGVSNETVAVLTAAVCAYEGKDVKITSIRRKKAAASRSEWSMAALKENTKPF